MSWNTTWNESIRLTKRKKKKQKKKKRKRKRGLPQSFYLKDNLPRRVYLYFVPKIISLYMLTTP